MKKYLIALLSFVSLSATAASGVKFGDWVVPLGKNHAYFGQVKDGHNMEFKLGQGWFAILEYPSGSENGRFDSTNAETLDTVFIVNGTRVKFTVKKDNKGWWMALPTTDQGTSYVIDCFWNSKSVIFTAEETGATFKASASGVQRAYAYILNNQAI